MNCIKVMLADDKEESLEILRLFLESLSTFKVVGVCNDGEELVAEIMIKKPDLLLVDINMPMKSGMSAVKECLSFYPDLKFIFISGYEQYALEAFEMSAIDYIVKPIEKARLYKGLEKARNIIQYEQNQMQKTKTNLKIRNLPIKDHTGTLYVPQQEIFYIEKSGKKCFIYTQKKVYETNENISKLLERLDDLFFPAHRSNIINLKRISHIIPQNETFVVYFHDFDKTASISKLKINEIKEKMVSLLDANSLFE